MAISQTLCDEYQLKANFDVGCVTLKEPSACTK